MIEIDKTKEEENKKYILINSYIQVVIHNAFDIF